MRACLGIAIIVAGCWTGSSSTETTPVAPAPAEPVASAPAEAAPPAGEPEDIPEDAPDAPIGVIGTLRTGPQAVPPPPPLPGATATVTPGATNVQGSLDRGAIRTVIHQNMARIRFCYEKQLLVDPALQGKVTVQFTIGPTGAVTQAIATGLHPNVEGCLRAAVSAMKFPAPQGGGTVTVSYPFVFKAR